MTRVLVAGVDTSTQSTKVRITDAATGEQVRFGQAKHPDDTSVNPEFWWEAFTKAAEQAGGLDDVAALAVGGQQHGMVILDKQGNVIRDAMLWNDTSSAPQSAALIDKLGATPAEGDEPDDVTARGKQRWVKAVGSSPVNSNSTTPANTTAMVITLMIGSFVAILNQTLMISALPTLMHEFDVPSSTVQWLTTGFMLTNGIMIPITAFLIETFTTRQLFLYAMGIFAE